jgi:virginiamycin A acetyltransferase
VAGNPGRVIRYRFDQTIIEELLALRWWDLSDEIVDSLLPLLMSNNAPALLAALREARAGEGGSGS